jgi:hypothetical protein
MKNFRLINQGTLHQTEFLGRYTLQAKKTRFGLPNVKCIGRYGGTIQQSKKPWYRRGCALYRSIQQAYGTRPEGPRRGLYCIDPYPLWWGDTLYKVG